MTKEEEIVMSHRDIFAKDIEWGQGSEDGIEYTRFLLEEDNPKGPMIVMSTYRSFRSWTNGTPRARRT